MTVLLCAFGALVYAGSAGNLIKMWPFLRVQVFTLSLICLSTSLANAQVQKDPTAVSTIQLELASMGGAPALGAIQDATVVGQAQAGSTGAGASSQMTWKSVAMAVRCETTTSSGTSIFTAANGVGYLEDASGNVSQMSQRQALSTFAYVMPGVVLKYLLNASDESLSIIQDQGSNSNVVHIQAIEQLSDPILAAATKQDWYIDLNTGLPTRVDYDLVSPTGTSPDGTATVLFNSWQSTSTVLVPQTIQLLQNGTVQSVVTLSAPAFNQGLQQSIFTLP